MRVARFALLATALIAACASPAADDELDETHQAFVGGRPDTDRLGAGYLVRDGITSCSGSLVDRDLVVTAAHCVSDDREAIEFGWGDASAGTKVKALARAVHPRYIAPPKNAGVAFQGFDVALVRLEHPIDVPPVRIGATPRMGRVHAIGYGATAYVEREDGKVEPRGVGTERRSADGFIIGVNPTEVFVRFGLEASACYGDSGSPLFAADGTVIGLLSRFTGLTRCEPRMGSLMGYTRLDIMGDFFRAARACLGEKDVASCLREDDRRLCDEPRFSNRAAPRPLIRARGNGRRGAAAVGLDAHEERSLSVTPPVDVELVLSSEGDAAMDVYTVDGAEVAERADRVRLAAGTSYELVIRSCNGTRQAVSLAWKP